MNQSSRSIKITLPGVETPEDRMKFEFEGLFTGQDMHRVVKRIWREYRLNQLALRKSLNVVKSNTGDQNNA